MMEREEEKRREIGGYFSLALPFLDGDLHPYAMQFQSARAALRSFIEHSRIKRVFIPEYVCDAVIRSLCDAGAYTEKYHIDDEMYPLHIPTPLPDGSVVLYVNYFGLCESNVGKLINQVSGRRLIVDNSQSLFSEPVDAMATIYSIRKFVGVPDGGLLVSLDATVPVPAEEDLGSIARMKHLLMRMAYPAQSGYEDYIEAESSLVDTTPLRMSRLTNRLIASIDWIDVRQRRRDNFAVLDARLGQYNAMTWALGSKTVPLCYPLIISVDAEPLRRRLAAKGIYIPNYWPELRGQKLFNMEHLLVDKCLPLPCDQRYTEDDMTYLAEQVISLIGEVA